MRNTIIAALITLTAAITTSCEKVTVDDTTSTKQQTKNVKFKITGINITTSDFDSTDDATTRASLTEAGCTDLYVIDTDGTVLAHQISTDSDYGQPNIALTYGQHKMAIIATKSTDATVSNGKLTVSKVKESFCKYLTLTVSATTLQQNITLSRAVAGIAIMNTANTTDPITQVRVTMAKAYNALTVPELTGIETQNDIRSVTTPATTFQTNVSITLYSFSPTLTEEWTTDVTIDFLNAEGTVLYTHNIKDVPLLNNRKTNIRGNFFGTSTQAKFTVDTAWLTEHNINL